MRSGQTPPSNRPFIARRVVLPLFFLAFASPLAAEPNPPAWKFDTLRLKNGSVLRGLLLEETPTHLRFQNVRRQTGRATVLFTALFAKAEIERCERLSDADRKLLRERLAELESATETERQRMDSLELAAAEWGGNPKGGLRYESDHFTLVSNAPEEIVRRSAVRVEQIYAAYGRFLPARIRNGQPTTILLYASPDDYQKALAGQGWKFLNPAFFDPAHNRIACSSDLQRLGEDLHRVRSGHQQQRDELTKLEAEFRRLYAKKKDELARHLSSTGEMRKLLDLTDRRNDALFDKATRQLFGVLYHEAFHAYVNGFVYPAGKLDGDCPGELPRWLNEGLAQIFETAILEAGELRLGHAERERLMRVKELVRKGDLLPMKELLRSGAKQFVVVHGGDRFDSDRAYLTSWCVSYYLMFDRKLLGTTAFDEFVRDVNRQRDPLEAFGRLTGQALERFEKDFQQYLLRLQPDGTLAESVSGN